MVGERVTITVELDITSTEVIAEYISEPELDEMVVMILKLELPIVLLELKEMLAVLELEVIAAEEDEVDDDDSEIKAVMMLLVIELLTVGLDKEPAVVGLEAEEEELPDLDAELEVVGKGKLKLRD